MKKHGTKAFTFVELIVVITILAILGTIAFISLQGYSANARDSVRISNLTNMDKGLALIQAKDGKLPDPAGSVTTITSSGSHILTQGEFTQTMAEQLLKMSGDITDPVDSANPIYTTSSDKKYYQVALFLEAENLALSDITHPNLPFTMEGIAQQTHAADGKTFISKGSKLGVIMTSTETPVNQDATPPTTLELNTTTTHIAYLDESTKIESSGTDLANEIEIAISLEKSLAGSCKQILERGLGNTTGEYTILVDGTHLKVYCDMTTDGGGWTLVLYGNEEDIHQYDTNQYWRNENTFNEAYSSAFNQSFKFGSDIINTIRGGDGVYKITGHRIGVASNSYYVKPFTYVQNANTVGGDGMYYDVDFTNIASVATNGNRCGMGYWQGTPGIIINHGMSATDCSLPRGDTDWGTLCFDSECSANISKNKGVKLEMYVR